jgi:hypothetical protein
MVAALQSRSIESILRNRRRHETRRRRSQRPHARHPIAHIDRRRVDNRRSRGLNRADSGERAIGRGAARLDLAPLRQRIVGGALAATRQILKCSI